LLSQETDFAWQQTLALEDDRARDRLMQAVDLRNTVI
jgi:hypothetical protein